MTNISSRSHQIYLLFSPKSIPLAELLFYSIHLKDTQALKLGLHSNLLLSQSTLIIPKGLYGAEKRTTLTGKTTILRFFSRLAKKDVDPFKQVVSEELVESLRTTPIGDVTLKNVLVSQKAPFGLGVDDSSASGLRLVDCLGLDWLSQTLSLGSSKLLDEEGKEWWNVTPSGSGWWSSLNSNPHVVWARSCIRDTLCKLPPLDFFKNHVVEQVIAKHSAASSEQVLALMQPMNNGYGVGVNIHKLNFTGGKPADLAAQLVKKFEINDIVSNVQLEGPFINFTFNHVEMHKRIIKQILRTGVEYGHNSTGFGKFAICEFSSPNIAKPFHAGHLRSTIIGSFIQKLLIANGWDTMSINYLGDWGKQYGLLAVGFEKYGSESELENDPIKHLFDVYVKINQDANENDAIHDEARAYFKRMENGDEKALAYWRKFRDLSIVAYKNIYARINVHFDLYSGESQYSLDQMRDVLKGLQEKKLLTTLEGGALAVDLKEYDLGCAVIGKTDGSMLYLSRDIAAASHRQKLYDFDDMYYVVATQQNHHFKQLFKILNLQGKPWADKCHHIDFGLIKSKDGNMSTRKGTVVFLQEILDHVKEEMHEVMKKNEAKYSQIENPESVADIVGISAIIIQDLSARRHKDYAFDWNRMLSFEGDTGPYLQYAHSRLCSIERKSSFKLTMDNAFENLDILTEKSALDLIDIIGQYPELVRDLSATLEPCTLVKYSWKLAHAVSAAYQDVWVHGQEEKIAIARLALYTAARYTLGNALRMLGLQPLERM